MLEQIKQRLSQLQSRLSAADRFYADTQAAFNETAKAFTAGIHNDNKKEVARNDAAHGRSIHRMSEAKVIRDRCKSAVDACQLVLELLQEDQHAIHLAAYYISLSDQATDALGDWLAAEKAHYRG